MNIPESPAFTPDELADLFRLAGTDALRRHLRGFPLTLGDAYEFWAVSSETPSPIIRRRLAALTELLARALSASVQDPSLPGYAKRCGLKTLDGRLQEQFKREIDALTTRE